MTRVFVRKCTRLVRGNVDMGWILSPIWRRARRATVLQGSSLCWFISGQIKHPYKHSRFLSEPKSSEDGREQINGMRKASQTRGRRDVLSRYPCLTQHSSWSASIYDYVTTSKRQHAGVSSGSVGGIRQLALWSPGGALTGSWYNHLVTMTGGFSIKGLQVWENRLLHCEILLCLHRAALFLS